MYKQMWSKQADSFWRTYKFDTPRFSSYALPPGTPAFLLVVVASLYVHW